MHVSKISLGSLNDMLLGLLSLLQPLLKVHHLAAPFGLASVSLRRTEDRI
jgi:hypothetical protein